jgi:hypothetical protein
MSDFATDTFSFFCILLSFTLQLHIRMYQVDAYEQEVGILEKTLEQLKAHQWGTSDNAGALAEALSMDRGQQVYGTIRKRFEF